ncbi:MAG: hypothetical protein ACXAD7_05750 [Candidatus Kariarchaeaceae archaeon]|jgi:hypothetical protein
MELQGDQSIAENERGNIAFQLITWFMIIIIFIAMLVGMWSDILG